MKKKLPGFLFLAMAMMGSCRNTDTKTEPESVHLIEKADWLIGEWQCNSETKDSLFAQISGMYKGKQESERYPMHLIK